VTISRTRQSRESLTLPREKGVALDIRFVPDSTHTADDAARVLDVDLGQIVKSLVFVARGLRAGWRPSFASFPGATKSIWLCSPPSPERCRLSRPAPEKFETSPGTRSAASRRSGTAVKFAPSWTRSCASTSGSGPLRARLGRLPRGAAHFADACQRHRPRRSLTCRGCGPLRWRRWSRVSSSRPAPAPERRSCRHKCGHPVDNWAGGIPIRWKSRLNPWPVL